MLLNPLTYHGPKSLAEAARLFGRLENVKIQAGGTFLLNSLKMSKRKGSKTPDNVIGLGQIKELKGIVCEGQKCIIRAMTTIDELMNSVELPARLDILREVCKNISTQPIRNMATVGGNLTCRYTWTEMPAVMIALDAQMHFINANGQEYITPAEEFYAQNAKTDILFSHVSIDANEKRTFSYQRVRKSASVDIPLLSLLINTKIDNGKFSDTHIGVNNCVLFAQRDKKLEEFLNNKKCDKKLADEALNHLTEEIYNTRSSDYKKHMFRVVIKNAVTEIVTGN